MRALIGMTGLYATTLKSFESFLRRFSEHDGLDLEAEIAMYLDGGLGILDCMYKSMVGMYNVQDGDSVEEVVAPLFAEIEANVKALHGAVATIEQVAGDARTPCVPASRVNLTDLTNLLMNIRCLSKCYVSFVKDAQNKKNLAASIKHILDTTAEPGSPPTDTEGIDRVYRRYKAMADEGIAPDEAFSAAMLEMA
jgi:hypothetical protein